MTITIISPTHVLVDTPIGEHYAELVGGNWLWSKTGRLVGYSVVRAIERAMRGAV